MAICFDRERPGQLRDMKPDEIGGETAKYRWQQTNWELWCYVPVPPETLRSDIQCEIGRRRLSLYVFGEKILDGKLTDNVDQYESSWTLDVLKPGPVPRKEISLVLIKEMETQGRNHWPAVVEGEPEINVRWLGAPIKVIHPADTETLKLLADTAGDQDRSWCNMRDPLAIPGK